MASINSLKASDGSGNAAVATVQSTRTALASTIIVNTVSGIPPFFHATMGTPHTFTDPITSETITVISEATAVDFKGHVDGINLEIDTIAPGYTDAGSQVGDIVIIRPTTQWADEAADVLEVAHNDDGTLKDDAVTTDVIINGGVTPDKLDLGQTNSYVSNSQSTTSTSYTDLATAGPAATVDIGANGSALVIITCAGSVGGVYFGYLGFAVSGATTVAASDSFASRTSATSTAPMAWAGIVTGLTPGSNTFTAKYKTQSGLASFADRRIVVIPL